MLIAIFERGFNESCLNVKHSFWNDLFPTPLSTNTKIVWKKERKVISEVVFSFNHKKFQIQFLIAVSNPQNYFYFHQPNHPSATFDQRLFSTSIFWTPVQSNFNFFQIYFNFFAPFFRFCFVFGTILTN
jgi:hypothetical protein